jgi:hypothetical protein
VRAPPTVWLFLALLAPASAAAAECAPLAAGHLGSPAREALRLAQLRGAPGPSLLLRRGSDDLAPAACPAAAVDLAPVEARATFLGGYPDDRNDGLLWAGRGASTSLTLGAVARWGFLSAGAIPAVSFSHNRPYPRRAAAAPGVSPYAHPFLAPSIDLPTRMGNGAERALDPGQSFLRADLGGFALGVATEALWWGPGLGDALLLTNTGPGFPHAFLGTRAPRDVWIGRLEAQLVLGRLSTSRYLAADGRVDHAVLRAAAIAFEPRFARGLFLGFAHAEVGCESGAIARSALRHLAFRGACPGLSRENALSSLHARWVVPAARLELYGEYGRDDTAALLDLLMEPERSAAWIAGLQKLFGAGRRQGRLLVEVADTFEVPAVNAPLSTPIFYTHGEGTSYSHRGQALGAAVGPAARSQLVALDLLAGTSRLGVYAERRLRNLRAFYDSFAQLKGRDLELGGGVRGGLSRGPVDLDWQAGVAHRWNAEFVGSAWQPAVRVTLVWHPASRG